MQYLSRRGKVSGATVTMVYDSLYQLVSRSIPTIHYPRRSFGGYGFSYGLPGYKKVDGTGWLYPNGITIPTEVETFTYDPMGRVLTADNYAARVTRTYLLNGLLETEAQQVAYHDGTFGSKHQFTLRNRYDMSGRRISLRHPEIFRTNGTTPTPFLDSLTRWSYKPYGVLDSLVDPRGQIYRFDFDGLNRVTWIGLPNGVSRNYEYSLDGDLRRARVLTPVNEDFPYGVARDWGMSYDSRGKPTRSRDTKPIPNSAISAVSEMHVQAYSPSGAMISSDHVRCDWECRNVNNTWLFSRKEKVHPDPLGKPLFKVQFASGPAMTDTIAYDPVSGRVRNAAYRDGGWHWSSTDNVYDESGNLLLTSRFRTVGGCGTGASQCGTYVGSYRFEELYANYYDMGERLRYVDHTSRDPFYNVRGGFEEFRYDALGRRVLTWFRQDKAPGRNNLSHLRRYVYDGNQVLYEIQAPGLDSMANSPAGREDLERDQQHLLGEYPYESGKHGTVLYVHGLSIDHPLAAIKVSYFPPDFGNGVTVFPHEDWQGGFDQGTREDGYLDGGVKGINKSMICWESRRMTVERDYARPANNGCEDWTFWGSLLETDRTGTGLNYKRNRFFDPVTGQFTQEDPIGLAGGLNLYGFASGDHVNYSDPFGLCVPLCPAIIAQAAGMVTSAGQAVAAAATAIVVVTATPIMEVGLELHSIAQLKLQGMRDAHHIIQDAAARDLPGYNSRQAPGVQLPGPANTSGTPHHATRAIQQQRGGGTYGAERRIAYKSLRAAGFTPEAARRTIEFADAYFTAIGVTNSTPTRIPGDRK